MTNKLRLETKFSKGATIKKAILILSALATLSWGQFVWADETYTYTGPNFTIYSGNYDATMSITGSITTSAPIPPNLTECTVEKVAINAVMAGCKPEYMPVILASVDAALDPLFTLHGLLCTTCFSGPIIIVNGPIAKKAGGLPTS